MSIKSQISRTFSTRVVTILLSFITSIFITRLLGVEGKGEFAIFNASLSVFSLILGFGLPAAIIYYVSREELDISKLLITSVLGILICGFIFFGILHYVQHGSKVSIFLHYNRSGWLYQILLITCLVLNLIILNLKAVLISQKWFKDLNTFEIFCTASGLIVYAILFFLNLLWMLVSIEIMFIVFTLLVFIYFAVLCVILYKKGVLKFKNSLLSRDSIKLLMSFAMLNYFGGIIQFLNYSADLWLVDYFTTPQQLGIYSLSSNLAQMLWVLPQSIGTVLLPHISSNQEESFFEKTLKLGRFIVFLYTFGAIVSFFLMEHIIVIMYGESFRASGQIFNILLLGAIPLSLTVIFSTYFSGNNKQYITLYAAIIGLFFTFTLDILLIPKFGNVGAAIASACSYTATSAFVIYNFLKESKASIYDVLFLTKKDIAFIYIGLKKK